MIEYEITVVMRAKTGDFPTVSACVSAAAAKAEEITHPYGGYLVKLDTHTKDSTPPMADRVTVVMKATGVLNHE